ncbi:RNA helicase [Desulfovibrio sp. JC010]|uniref:RNA helicase n=1 Tax=Desulfovibrio sp. JC010 TaxID=2593641 RepID=UPI0013D84118|nr:RNA helicase [Desulfovibrio sp. JC010]NDV27735.1 RNA helicase [Desulfovibrio sp. JC010]
MSTSSWPPMLQELAATIGREPALVLAEEIGGVSKYIPTKATASHELAKLVGVERMAVLCEVYGGVHLTIPRGVNLDPAKPQIKELLGKMSGRKIAQKLGVSERYVRKVANEAPKPQQSMLPGL